MPVRSLHSSVLTWPDQAVVRRAAEAWARRTVQEGPHVRRIGYFGSYARGDWGVGSDLDLVIVVAQTDRPFAERSALFDTTTLPGHDDPARAGRRAGLHDGGVETPAAAKKRVWGQAASRGPMDGRMLLILQNDITTNPSCALWSS